MLRKLFLLSLFLLLTIAVLYVFRTPILRSAATFLIREDSLQKADAIFNKLMGTEVELRKGFIQANAKFVKDLDI